jgi:CelD/BcsL family acetyltransferase involved in cellulose biosynthesis
MVACSELSLSIVDGPESIRAIAVDWDACVLATGADIQFTADWVLTWWSHFGGTRRLAAICLKDGARIVGVLPLCIETVWAGPFPVRVARIAGADHNYPIMRFALPADRIEIAFAQICAQVFGANMCHLLSLSPVSGASLDLLPIRAAAAVTGLEVGSAEATRKHVLMRLPATVEDFWAGLSGSRRKEHRRSLRKMEELWKLSHRTSTPDTVSADFERFAALHGAQWAATGRGGHYSDWPGSFAYYRDLLVRLAPLGRGFVEEHLGSGELLSSQLTFRLGSATYWRLTARSLDPEAARTGSARVGMVERIEQLFGTSSRTLEMGAGDYSYKLSFGGELIPLHQVALYSRLGLGRLLARTLLAWCDLVDYLYYRLWFIKLAPPIRDKLRLKPRPLWRLWIRTRL